MTTLFRSKVDTKLKVIGLSVPAVAVCALAAHQRLATADVWLPLIAMGLVAVLVAWVVLSTYYQFEHDTLVAHSGPFSWRIPLKEIRAVRESNSVRSGPALSLDRLEIAYGDGKLMLISPADKAGFLALLQRRAPQL